ncbi:glycosyltransferase, partial [bacterium]|nr:glycosyltransferase [bacterium]
LVSIVILTKKGGSLFQSCLDTIYDQIVDFSFEVVIVDSGSTDGTLQYIKKYPVRLYEIKSHEFSFGRTRDYAFGLSKGRYIVTLSQDVVPVNGNWLKKLIEPLAQDSADVVQGKVIVPVDREIFYWEKKGFFYFTREGAEFFEKYGEIGLSCCNLAIKRQAWEDTRFGGALMNEDKVIQRKLYEKGYRIVWAPDAIAYHGHSYNLKSLKNRCENEGLGWKCAGVKYRFPRMVRDLVQGKWVYGLLLKGLIKKEIRTVADVLFLFIRPLYLFKGNRFNKILKK